MDSPEEPWLIDDLRMMLHAPVSGVFLHGLFLQNALFDKGSMKLAEFPPAHNTALQGAGTPMQKARLSLLPLVWLEPITSEAKARRATRMGAGPQSYRSPVF